MELNKLENNNIEVISIQDLKNRIEKLQEAWDNALTKIFRDNIYRLIDEQENLNSIHWENYAFYFNDGDPCEFRARVDSVIGEDKDGAEVSCNDKIIEFLSLFPDRWYELKFGNDSQVTISKDGTLQISDYTDHN